jgi:hypothetical protein
VIEATAIQHETFFDSKQMPELSVAAIKGPAADGRPWKPHTCVPLGGFLLETIYTGSHRTSGAKMEATTNDMSDSVRHGEVLAQRERMTNLAFVPMCLNT